MTDVRRLPGPSEDAWGWQLEAACRGLDVERFFHPDNERGPMRQSRELAAKAVCDSCPVIRQCGLHALRSREPYGIWGGLSEADREDIWAGRRPVPAYLERVAS